MTRYQDTPKNANLQAALALARAVIPVLPVEIVERPGKDPVKKPCITGWQEKATTDLTQIEQWWRKFPHAMPGIPTGSCSGLDVLDVDQKNGKDGFAGLKQLGLNIDDLSPVQVESPGGSRHLYYKHTEGIGCSNAGLPAGLDVKGDGGYVLAPGAVTAKGTYTVLKGVLTSKLPGWPEALPIRRKTATPGEGKPMGLPFKKMAEALMAIPNSGDAYADRGAWLSMVMALHCETGGSGEGLTLLHQWSRQHPSYDADHTDAAWRSCKAEGGLTGWHIINEAERHCWSDPAVAELRTMALREEAEEDFDFMLSPEEEAEIDALVGGVRTAADNSDDDVKADGDEEEGSPFFTDMADMLSEPAPSREWHVPDWIPAKTVHMLAGDGGSGKSLLGIQLAVATGTGAEWLGHDVAKPGVAIYYGAEDDRDELHRRFADVCRGLDVAPTEHPGRVLLRSAVAEDTVFATLGKDGKVRQSAILKRIDREIAAAKPTLVVLDTLANLHALDPNSQEQAKAFVGLLIGIAQRRGCTFILLAHPSRTGMATGDGDGFSVGWSNAVRSRSYLATDKDDPTVNTLTVKKANYGKRGLEMKMRWVEGVFEKVSNEYVDALRAKHVFLEILDRTAGQKTYFSNIPGTNYAPSRFAEEPEAEAARISKDQFARAMKVMLKDRVLALEEYQTGQRKTRKRIARGDFDLVTVGEDFTDDMIPEAGE